MKNSAWSGILLSVLLPLGAAHPAEATNSFERVAPSALPAQPLDGELGGLKTALTRQVAVCMGQDLTAKRSFGTRTVTRQRWCVDTAQEAIQLIAQSTTFAGFLAKARKRFEWYRTVGSDGQGLVRFTGYNSPTLHGSRAKSGPYQFPIYFRPADLVEATENGKTVWRRKTASGALVPYYNRSEIDQAGALAGKGLEIAYVDDLLSVSIFQIEGAGSILLEQGAGSGKKLRLNYAAQNGYPVTTPRKVLQSQGVAAEYLTIPGMRRYFREHPSELVPVLSKNESYIFFDESTEEPKGVDGLTLTASHSLAVDLKVFPVGALSFFTTQKPVFNSAHDDAAGFEPFARFGVTQDTGGSITGPGRCDIYWGDDDYAELASGTVNHPGELFVALLP